MKKFLSNLFSIEVLAKICLILLIVHLVAIFFVPIKIRLDGEPLKVSIGSSHRNRPWVGGDLGFVSVTLPEAVTVNNPSY